MHASTINGNYIMFGSCDMEREWTDLFVILKLFLVFQHADNPENLNFEKMRKKKLLFYTCLT